MMKSTMTAVGALLAGAALAAAPAKAQAAAQEAAAQPAAENPNAIRTHAPKISRQANKAIGELQTAVNENKAEEIPAATAAAQAAAQTEDDRYAIAILQLRAAASTQDNAGVASALEAMLASGSVTEDEKFPLYLNLAQTYDALKQPERAAHYYQLALQQNPNSIDATAGSCRIESGSGPGRRRGRSASEGHSASVRRRTSRARAWLKRALSGRLQGETAQAIDLSREWVKAYPTNEAWQNSLAIYQNLRPAGRRPRRWTCFG
jgi:tetratricopeptide (TPR) repeat protein